MRGLIAMIHPEHRDMADADAAVVSAFSDQPEQMAALVMLPIEVILNAEHRRKSGMTISTAMALLVQAAAAMLLLGSSLVRRATLIRTRLEHLHLPPGEGRAGEVRWPSDTVKSRKPVVAHLSAWKVHLLRIYLKHYRPVLLGKENGFLFPARRSDSRDGHLKPAQLAKRIQDVVRDNLGIALRCHQWRKVLGEILFQHTNDPALVRAILGHSAHSSSTARYIRDLESRHASRSVDEALGALLGEVITGANLKGTRK